MGNVESVTNITNNVLNKSVTNILQRNSVNVSTNIRTGQSVTYRIIESTVNCTDVGGLITQKITANINLVDQVTLETTNELTTLFKQAADSQSSQFQKVTQELGGGIGLSEAQKQTITTNIQNIIETTVTQENLTNIVRSVALDQDGNVLIQKSVYTGPCAVAQDLVLSLQASAIIGALVANITKNEAISDIVTKAKQEQIAELKGLSDVIKSVGDAVSKVITAAMSPLLIAAVVVGVLVLVPMMGGFIGSKPEVKAKDGTVIQEGRSTLKVAGIVFIVTLILSVIIVVVVLRVQYSRKKWPFEEIKYPDDVMAKNCTAQYDKMAPIKKQIDAQTSDEERNKILLQNKDTINEYGKCMGLNRT